MLAIIGGTGLTSIDYFESVGCENVITPFADEPISVSFFRSGEIPLAFLPRHGEGHKLPPHKINYRANIWALKELGVSGIIAVNAVGGIHEKLGPSCLAIPDQIIDYTWGRDSTYFADNLEEVTHIDFTNPFDEKLRQRLIGSISGLKGEAKSDFEFLDSGVYGCTQGPRLETAAEIRKLRQDGCDLVGMTAMPEAALARELNLPYAMLALSVNWAAGLSTGEISMDEINKVLDEGMGLVSRVLAGIANS
jgi:5'-deoxy-5'-methylthioadenosine phosphorylase|tara:strand:+ start:853 stop:1602 length:750 start_codon:yes stop_codon:yes gene_type:complete